MLRLNLPINEKAARRMNHEGTQKRGNLVVDFHKLAYNLHKIIIIRGTNFFYFY
jgi:hypothetical protein